MTYITKNRLNTEEAINYRPRSAARRTAEIAEWNDAARCCTFAEWLGYVDNVDAVGVAVRTRLSWAARSRRPISSGSPT